MTKHSDWDNWDFNEYEENINRKNEDEKPKDNDTQKEATNKKDYEPDPRGIIAGALRAGAQNEGFFGKNTTDPEKNSSDSRKTDHEEVESLTKGLSVEDLENLMGISKSKKSSTEGKASNRFSRNTVNRTNGGGAPILPRGSDLVNDRSFNSLNLPKDCVMGERYGRRCVIKTINLKNSSDIMLQADIDVNVSIAQREGFTVERIDHNPIDMAKYLRTGREKFRVTMTFIKYVD